MFELRKSVIATLLLLAAAAYFQSPAQTAQRSGSSAAAPQAAATPTRDELLRGGYGPFRSNNDLLFYHLNIRVDPERKFLSGKNTIRFRMLKDDSRIQIDLHQALNVDKILYGNTQLK